MSPDRSEPGLMHRAVGHGDTIYLAGIVADDLGAYMEGQTRDELRQLDGFAERQGLDRTRNPQRHGLFHRHGRQAGDEPRLAGFDPAHLPTRATSGVADLKPGVRFEMSACSS